ncbi:hypothetical protein HYH02_013094 [Chlamydomonas schloesseri]|uniref:Peptidyl-prolyl cis-trans isomerase CYP38-like PsbQ-like domain-containing protein n=1 Tax=Chlamydomonas schloesseri TaxID=2026947 RepID=A0A835SRT1_9CHLO|nr:hypothetical protein HYH02_013094 [Chlamydomonas schloesseri]|eukprot:KAG2432024.1 hypothetical protein HYH02_013094 [Chlamydomonas schloesseri]
MIVSSSVVLPAGPAEAVLNSPNAQIARSVDAALRRAIPAFNPQVKKIQRSLEEVQYLLRIPQRKPWASMAESVAEALEVSQQREVMLAGLSASTVPAAEPLLDSLSKSLRKLELAVKTQQPDAVALRVSDSLKAVAELELLQAPGLPFLIPKEYASLPRLVGRAVVELTLEKRDGSLGFLDPVAGGPAKQAVLRLTLDGYSAPLSAGAFLRNVKEGMYDGRPISANYTSVLVTAPEGKQQPPVPLEIMPLGEFEPLYRLPLDVQSGELPVLPLSISGAVTFARLPSTESYLSGTDWFVYKFDKQQAGLGGLAFDEGQFGVFGYVTEGLEGVLPRLAPGDVIVQAKIISGGDKLVVP